MHLLDTGVVIDHFRNKSVVVEKLGELLPDGFALSTVSLAELFHGARKSDRPSANIAKIEKFISIPELKVLPLSKAVAEEYGLLMAEMETQGVKLAAIDTLIAATARFYDFTILATDQKHFPRLKDFGVEVVVV